MTKRMYFRKIVELYKIKGKKGFGGSQRRFTEFFRVKNKSLRNKRWTGNTGFSQYKSDKVLRIRLDNLRVCKHVNSTCVENSPEPTTPRAANGRMDGKHKNSPE